MRIFQVPFSPRLKFLHILSVTQCHPDTHASILTRRKHEGRTPLRMVAILTRASYPIFLADLASITSHRYLVVNDPSVKAEKRGQNTRTRTTRKSTQNTSPALLRPRQHQNTM